MKTIIVLNSKGGVGKSSITRHLAVAAEQENPGKVIICDTDPQGTLADWWNIRESETPAFATLKVSEFAAKKDLLASKFKYIFLDTAAADARQYATLLKAVDYILIPVVPSPDDIRSLAKITLPVVKKSRKRFGFVLSRARAGTQLLAPTIAALSQDSAVCISIIQQRESYAKSAYDGSTVLEDEPNGKGAQEIRSLWTFVKTRLNEKSDEGYR